MGIFDLFRPKWRHSDPDRRAEAVRDLGPEQLGVLAEVARTDPDARVRRIAVKRLDDPATLRAVASGDPDEGIRALAGGKADDLLVGVATGSTASEERALAAVADLTAAAALAEVARRSASDPVRRAALARIDDGKALADLVARAESIEIRLGALARLREPSALAGIAAGDENKRVAEAALARVQDVAALETIAKSARVKAIRAAARAKLPKQAASQAAAAAPVAESRSEGKTRRARLMQLCVAAEAAASRSDWAAAEAELAALKERWDEIGATAADKALATRFEGAQRRFATRRQADAQAREAAAAKKAREAAEAERARRAKAAEKAPDAVAPAGATAEPARSDATPPAAHDRAPGDERRPGKRGAGRAAGAAGAAPADAAAPTVATEPPAAPAKAVEDQLASLCAELENLRAPPRALEERLREIEARWRHLDGELPAEPAPSAAPTATAGEAAPAKARAGEAAPAKARAGEAAPAIATTAAEPAVATAEPAPASVSASATPTTAAEPAVATAEPAPAPAPASASASATPTTAAEPAVATAERAPAPAPASVSASATPTTAAEPTVATAERAPAPAPATAAEPAVATAEATDGTAGASPGRRELLRQRFAAARAATRGRLTADAERRAAKVAEARAKVEKACADAERLLAGDKVGPKGLERAAAQLQSFLRAPAGEVEAALRERLRTLKDRVVARLGELREAESWRRWANVPKLEKLCAEAEALAEVVVEVEDKRRAPKVLKDLQARWKEAGPAPAEKQEQLWGRFKKACDAVYEKCREYFDKLEGERGANLAKKEELCVKVEALVDSTEWKATSEQIKALQEEWKAIGPVPQDKADAIWKRFRAACDTFFTRRDANDKGRDEERLANLRKKEELCAQAETLASSTDWRPASDRIKALQEEWREIGPTPREGGDAVWKRFRAACDRFFDARKAAFEAQDGERIANLAKKTVLCERAEALASSEDPEAALEEIRALQAEWKLIGHVPREMSDAIWRRFRAACDAVYDGPRLSPEQAEVAATGISGFTNRLPLDKIAAQIARRADAPTSDAEAAAGEGAAAGGAEPAAGGGAAAGGAEPADGEIAAAGGVERDPPAEGGANSEP